MSNPLAVATVTACLQRSLQEAILTAPIGAVAGATVKNGKPPAPGSAPTSPTVYLFLYQTTPNPHQRNTDLPTRDATGALRQRPRTALDLHYLLSFWGDESTLEPQRMLGVAEAVASGQCRYGVLMCWTGTGTAIAANKVRGVRAANAADAWTAARARRWNDANVLALSLKRLAPEVAVECVKAFLAVEAPDPDEVDTIRALGDV